MAKNQFLPNDHHYQEENSNSVNERNAQEFRNVMDHSKQNLDNYWDVHNPIIRFVLLITFFVAVIGATYYFIAWFL